MSANPVSIKTLTPTDLSKLLEKLDSKTPAGDPQAAQKAVHAITSQLMKGGAMGAVPSASGPEAMPAAPAAPQAAAAPAESSPPPAGGGADMSGAAAAVGLKELITAFAPQEQGQAQAQGPAQGQAPGPAQAPAAAPPPAKPAAESATPASAAPPPYGDYDAMATLARHRDIVPEFNLSDLKKMSQDPANPPDLQKAYAHMAKTDLGSKIETAQNGGTGDGFVGQGDLDAMQETPAVAKFNKAQSEAYEKNYVASDAQGSDAVPHEMTASDANRELYRYADSLPDDLDKEALGDIASGKSKEKCPPQLQAAANYMLTHPAEFEKTAPGGSVERGDLENNALGQVNLRQDEIDTIRTVQANKEAFVGDDSECDRTKLTALAADSTQKPEVRAAAQKLLDDPLVFGMLDNADKGHKSSKDNAGNDGKIAACDIDALDTRLTATNLKPQPAPTPRAPVTVADQKAQQAMIDGTYDQPPEKEVRPKKKSFLEKLTHVVGRVLDVVKMGIDAVGGFCPPPINAIVLGVGAGVATFNNAVVKSTENKLKGMSDKDIAKEFAKNEAIDLAGTAMGFIPGAGVAKGAASIAKEGAEVGMEVAAKTAVKAGAEAGAKGAAKAGAEGAAEAGATTAAKEGVETAAREGAESAVKEGSEAAATTGSKAGAGAAEEAAQTGARGLASRAGARVGADTAANTAADVAVNLMSGSLSGAAIAGIAGIGRKVGGDAALEAAAKAAVKMGPRAESALSAAMGKSGLGALEGAGSATAGAKLAEQAAKEGAEGASKAGMAREFGMQLATDEADSRARTAANNAVAEHQAAQAQSDAAVASASASAAAGTAAGAVPAPVPSPAPAVPTSLFQPLPPAEEEEEEDRAA
jgi:hypothetical protein